MMNYNKISIIIPVYNEEKTLAKLTDLVEKVQLPGLEKELIFIDDGSTDGGQEILKSFQGKHKIIFLDKNHGKGAAVRRGMKESTGDIVIIQDADLEYNPQEYGNIIKPILDGKADVVYGSRFVTGLPHRVLYYDHYLANKFLTFFSNVLTGLNLSDIETCYKAFSRRAVDQIKDHLKANRFGIEVELTAEIAKHNMRVFEVGISYNGRTYQEGKKIGWRDGLAAVFHIIKYNLFKTCPKNQ